MSIAPASTSRSKFKSKSRFHSSNKRHKNRANKEISVDNLFPSENKSGTRGKKLDINTLLTNAPLNNEPHITFTSDILLDRIKKRRSEKLLCYMNMLKYCHNRIAEVDNDYETDIIFKVVETIPECKDYDSHECLEYISIKLREDDFDTTILTDTTMFITWKYLELKRTDREQREILKKENEHNDDDGNDDGNDGNDDDNNKRNEHNDVTPIKQKRTKEVIITNSKRYDFM